MTRTILAAALAAGALLAAAPAASAETTCQAVDASTSVCVTTGTDGVGISAGPLCVVVLAACP